LPVYAELKPVEDTYLSEITGQAGITIEVDLQLKIDEIAYQDEGFISLENVIWAGVDRTGATGAAGSFNNWNMKIDLADGKEPLAYGFSELDSYYTQVTAPDKNWEHAITINDEARKFGPGDLVIHINSTQPFDGTRYDTSIDSDVAISGGSGTTPHDRFDLAMDDWRNAAPFALEIGALKLRNSNYQSGALGSDGALVMSDFKAEVLTGPLDIVIQNNGNGHTGGIPDSKITISDYFQISDLSVNLDVAGIGISGFRMHNQRGDTTGLNHNLGNDGIAGTSDDIATESFGFAHMKWFIGAAQNNDGMLIQGALKGDIDIDNVYIGGINNSIGAIQVTDLLIDSKLVIKGH
jgi:hypothetical protein